MMMDASIERHHFLGVGRAVWEGDHSIFFLSRSSLAMESLLLRLEKFILEQWAGQERWDVLG